MAARPQSRRGRTGVSDLLVCEDIWETLYTRGRDRPRRRHRLHPRRLPARPRAGARTWTRTPGTGNLCSSPQLECGAAQFQERCRSGRSGLTRNQVYARAYRGFESHPLRQSKMPKPRAPPVEATLIGPRPCRRELGRLSLAFRFSGGRNDGQSRCPVAAARTDLMVHLGTSARCPGRSERRRLFNRVCSMASMRYHRKNLETMRTVEWLASAAVN